ncbi:hypothetical protein AWJ20_5042 [Sugiyamaella lignohabitans]|uniref:Rhodopsin domain-containing protein n=1 Tax=Sugiyamaella lignohabitans TaxID=796027 RepID=A0A167EHF9_9ASCO|nr:uncharacterized protein AWJ20_5042 [Sugiyamaella lignohabitans]ANB14086.1 hypothetical protein AWJ20_5042 [Sugiyamaella lignohabitans]
MDPGMSYLNLPDGYHAPHELKVTVFKVVYASSVPYYICLWLIKFSLISLYYRLIPTGTKTRKLLHFTAGLTLVASLVILFLNLFLCVPISLNWALDNTTKTCYSSTAETPFITSVILNLIVDILIFSLPFSVIRKLKSVGKKQKIGLIATFSVGIVTIAIIVVRALIVALSGSISVAAILTAIECFTSMCVACMPVMRPLFKVRLFKIRRPRLRSFGSSGGKLSDSRYVDTGDMESTISFNEEPNNVPLQRLEKTNVVDYRSPMPSQSMNTMTTIVTTPVNHQVNNMRQSNHGSLDDDLDHSPTSSPVLLQQVRLQQEQERLHPISTNQQNQMPYHMGPPPVNAFPGPPVPAYVSNSPLPIPPPPNSRNQEEYIMPSYILNEPLPNPVI